MPARTPDGCGVCKNEDNIMPKTRGQKLSALLCGAAMAALLAVLLTLTFSSMLLTVREFDDNAAMGEMLLFQADRPLVNLLLTAGMIAVLALAARLLRAGQHKHLMRWLLALWLGATVFFLWGVRLQPRVDQLRVLDAALRFSRGDYSPMHNVYFHNYSYQLGICLFFEAIARLLPGLDLALTVQILNAVMTVGIVLVLQRFLALLTEEENAQHALNAMLLLFLPMGLYCIYVYGTIPMLLLTVCAFWGFALYARSLRVRHGIAWAACIALSVFMKPNAQLNLLVLVAASALLALNRRTFKPLLYAGLAVLLSMLLPRLAQWQYELRSGVTLTDDLSMLSRLVMGFQRSTAGAGWYNGYTERFSSWIMPKEESRAIILSDAAALAAEFAADPAMLLRFLEEKCASLWLEPSYSTLWAGSVSELLGRFNGLGFLLYRENSAMRTALEQGMDIYQQAMYALCCLGVLRTLRKRADPVQLLLPLTVLGGFAYHLLFEAKSQYIYPYAMLMIPLAAQGIAALMAAVRKARQK